MEWSNNGEEIDYFDSNNQVLKSPVMMMERWKLEEENLRELSMSQIVRDLHLC